MTKMREARARKELAELQAWYLERLWPKLAGSASAGTVTPEAAGALDRELRELFDLPRAGKERA